jgi:hypothetical protein
MLLSLRWTFSHILINLLIVINFNHKLHQLPGAKCLEVTLNEERRVSEMKKIAGDFKS